MDATTGTPNVTVGSPKAGATEARRRRIAERGSDRLALITGRIKSLPSETEPESESNQSRGHSYTVSCPPSISHIQLPSPDQSSESLDSSLGANKIRGSLPTNYDSIHEDQQSLLGGRVGPYMRKCESSTEVFGSSSFDVNMRGQSSQLTSRADSPELSMSNVDQHLASQSHANKLIILQDVSWSIAATESSRTLCSLAMAILVVLSYMGFPIVGSTILNTVISFRPLYLLLLTNITIVMAQLLEKHKGLQRPEHQTVSSPDGEDGLFDQLGNALEIGLTLQNVLGALFMDCSIYSIIVICSLSLAQKLGW